MTNRWNLGRAVAASVLGLLVVAAIGCGKAAPEGMPATVPFTVKVVDGGKGIADVQIQLINEKAQGSIAGKTDGSGVAKIKTTFKNFTADGAPTGEYRIRCIKDPLAEHWKTSEERAAMTIGEQAEYDAEYQEKCDALPREVPKVLGDYDNTPLTANVSDGGEVVVDVSEYNK